MVQAHGVIIGLSCPCGTKKWANIVDGTSYETSQNELCWNTRALLTSVRVIFSVVTSVLRLRLRNRSGLEQRQQCDLNLVVIRFDSSWVLAVLKEMFVILLTPKYFFYKSELLPDTPIVVASFITIYFTPCEST